MLCHGHSLSCDNLWHCARAEAPQVPRHRSAGIQRPAHTGYEHAAAAMAPVEHDLVERVLLNAFLSSTVCMAVAWASALGDLRHWNLKVHTTTVSAHRIGTPVTCMGVEPSSCSPWASVSRGGCGHTCDGSCGVHKKDRKVHKNSDFLKNKCLYHRAASCPHRLTSPVLHASRGNQTMSGARGPPPQLRGPTTNK